MSREIFFKAKRKDNGGWVEGYYIYHIKRTICPLGDSVKPEDEQHVIMQDGFSDWNMPRDTVVHEIDPDTLCQYTGLTGKDGKKIWENDILKCKKYIGGNFVDNCIEVGYVEMKHGAFGLHRIKNDAYYRPFKDWLEDYEYEVIGNIFDNPELLEVE